MVSINADLYFTNIHILPKAVNAMVCKSWYAPIISILKKKKQTFYELQIYNLIVNKYSGYPTFGCNARRRLDFSDKKGINVYDDNIFDIAYDNMIKQIFNYLSDDPVVFLNIKESLIIYYTKYISMYKKYCRMELLEMADNNEYIDKDIANEYKEILFKYYSYVIT
uniref:Uncharacterized protein n=1 Tax=viral metagenome TaxID=1070528 RepID=A0A6C0IAU0_9ZZZZ